MKYSIEVENIKCSGCVNTIKSEVLKISGVKQVLIDLEKETVTVEIDSTDFNKEQIVSKLESLGYPEKGHNNLLNKTKSYISCALGKIKDDVND